MNIKVEHYPNANIHEKRIFEKFFREKEVILKFTLSNNTDFVQEFTLNTEQARKLVADINNRLDNPVLAENGFELV